MKSERRDAAYVDDIIAAAAKIKKYVHGKPRAHYVKNDMLQDAVERQLLKIGEAAACISATFKAAHPKIPWKEIVGLRQIVVHKYWKVDTNIVWSTVKNDLQRTAAYLRRAKKRRIDAEVRELAASRKRPRQR